MKKKNLISTLALAALFIGGVQAQTSIILTPEIGIHSSKSQMTGDFDVTQFYQGADVSTTAIFGYQGGIGIGFQFKNWALLTGVKYNRKGHKVNVETRNPNLPFEFPINADSSAFDVGKITNTTTHNWLSIPILFRGQFGGTFKAGLAIGPQINMAIGKYKETIEYNLENLNINTEENNYDYGKTTREPIKKSHISLLVLPYVSYDISPKSSVRLSMMIEAGSNMVNDNFVVGMANGVRNVRATERNTQVGIMLSYEYRFELKAGVKY